MAYNPKKFTFLDLKTLADHKNLTFFKSGGKKNLALKLFKILLNRIFYINQTD
jgi:hypothetical protein